MKTPQGSEEFIAEQKMTRDEDTECANSQYNLGVSLMEQGRLDEAIEAFKDAIENSGRMFEGYVNLGYIYFKQGDLEMVVDANQKAVQIEPRYARGYANLGFAFLQMMKTEEAIEALNKAIELNPSSAFAHMYVGHVLGHQLEFAEQGLTHLELALRLSPRDPYTGPIMGRFSAAHYMLGNYEITVEYARKALA